MRLVTLIFLLVMAFPAFAYATAAQTKTTTAVTKLKVENEEDGPISNKLANDVYENCLFHIPQRFTPNAREYYCACNSASLQGNFKVSEYKEIQRESNRTIANKTYERYIATAVAPCLDMPVKEIEYLDCIIDSSADLRVGYLPGYCSCVSKKISAHAKKFADVELLKRIAEYPKDFVKEPVNALWDNQAYIDARRDARNECIINPTKR